MSDYKDYNNNILNDTLKNIQSLVKSGFFEHFKEENVFTLLFSFAVVVVFFIGFFKMGEYETQKAMIEHVKDGYFEDSNGMNYEEINQKIIELCKSSSNEQQCLRDFLK